VPLTPSGGLPEGLWQLMGG